MCANLGSQARLTGRVIQGRFIEVVCIFTEYSVLLQNVNKLVKWGSELCYTNVCGFKNLIGL